MMVHRTPYYLLSHEVKKKEIFDFVLLAPQACLKLGLSLLHMCYWHR